MRCVSVKYTGDSEWPPREAFVQEHKSKIDTPKRRPIQRKEKEVDLILPLLLGTSPVERSKEKAERNAKQNRKPKSRNWSERAKAQSPKREQCGHHRKEYRKHGSPHRLRIFLKKQRIIDTDTQREDGSDNCKEVIGDA